MESNKSLKISIIVDDSESWIIPYMRDLVARLSDAHEAALYHCMEDIQEGDCLFILGCKQIIPRNVLSRNKRNIVIHESRLPAGRGWSPVAWQILGGMNDIPVTLFEASEEVDSGPVYLTDMLRLKGDELLPEIRAIQGRKTIEMAAEYIDHYDKLEYVPQTGKTTYYRRRTEEDDLIDPSKTIGEQFDRLRIVDNERYPARFKYRGNEYILKIYKAK